MADEHEVLLLWEGLGYYRRARQLHQAAKDIVAEHGGIFPCDVECVRRLPGIGRYTAGAILSIAFDARQPILEANTIRLFSRLIADDGETHSPQGQKLLWAFAESILPTRHVGRFNQALMELGSLVCTIREPGCQQCPVAAHCQANHQGRQQEIPRPKTKRAIEAVREAAVLVRHRGRVLLVRWPEGRRWAGLWDFPRFPIHSEHPILLKEELIQNVLQLTGVEIKPGENMAQLTHSVTRFRITLDCHAATCQSSTPQTPQTGARLETRWLATSCLKDYPLSSTGRKLANLLQKRAAG